MGEMQKTRLFLKLVQKFSPAENYYSNGNVLCEKPLNDTQLETSARNKRDQNSTQEIRSTQLDHPEVPFLDEEENQDGEI